MAAEIVDDLTEKAEKERREKETREQKLYEMKAKAEDQSKESENNFNNSEKPKLPPQSLKSSKPVPPDTYPDEIIDDELFHKLQNDRFAGGKLRSMKVHHPKVVQLHKDHRKSTFVSYFAILPF